MKVHMHLLKTPFIVCAFYNAPTCGTPSSKDLEGKEG